MIRIAFLLLLILATGLACLALVGPAEGGGCAVVRPRFVARKRVVVKKVVKVVEPVFIKYVAVAAFAEFPTYSAFYTPPVAPAQAGLQAGPPAGAAPGGLGADARAIIDALRALDARIQKLEKAETPTVTPGPAAAPAPKQAAAPASKNALAVVQAKCSQCHESKVSADKGAGLTLITAGVLAKLTDAQSKKLVRVVLKGSMPKKPVPALTDEEGTYLIEFASQ